MFSPSSSTSNRRLKVEIDCKEYFINIDVKSLYDLIDLEKMLFYPNRFVNVLSNRTVSFDAYEEDFNKTKQKIDDILNNVETVSKYICSMYVKKNGYIKKGSAYTIFELLNTSIYFSKYRAYRLYRLKLKAVKENEFILVLDKHLKYMYELKK